MLHKKIRIEIAPKAEMWQISFYLMANLTGLFERLWIYSTWFRSVFIRAIVMMAQFEPPKRFDPKCSCPIRVPSNSDSDQEHTEKEIIAQPFSYGWRKWQLTHCISSHNIPVQWYSTCSMFKSTGCSLSTENNLSIDISYDIRPILIWHFRLLTQRHTTFQHTIIADSKVVAVSFTLSLPHLRCANFVPRIAVTFHRLLNA